jgi:hypothetical protein
MVLKKIRRLRRCSFCRKSEVKVAKLVCGSNAYICDLCVGVCNRILEATPSDFAGWDSLADERLLESLRPSVATIDAYQNVLQAQVDILRGRGISWAAIGGALGISRQAAWERFS